MDLLWGVRFQGDLCQAVTALLFLPWEDVSTLGGHYVLHPH